LSKATVVDTYYFIAGPAEQKSAQTGGQWSFTRCGLPFFHGALLRQNNSGFVFDPPSCN
jgi:hypothetical protein